MPRSRLIATADNNNEGQVIINWAQVPDNDIRYDTNNEEEVMRAKVKERKRHKVAEQAWWEEQAWLEAKRVEREQAKAKRAAWERAKAKRAEREAKEKKVHEEEERWEAKCKCKGDEASAGGASGEARGEVKRVVMDPGCTCCAWAKVVCKFLVDGNKKRVACMRCNQSKGKCWWPGDGKDTKASPKAGRADKGKKQKADEENAEAGPSTQKWARMSARLTEVLDLDEPEASRSRMKEAGMARYLGLENKLKQLIEATGLIANNLASLFELHETAIKNSG
ncbi:hypothetical protein M404DRAFT_18633 [Pisolithus tinctorius Marx 270]|uniref:Uncharacterized protein n=1 Tax=Pisolithus tinctorius Marx 270 TaxID=870435 RepID=A0A0C3KU83_PISTI|nr:hypothetical protein M404DRAFT_18633 [Pisolithus tinctorius Marx 270]